MGIFYYLDGISLLKKESEMASCAIMCVVIDILLVRLLSL